MILKLDSLSQIIVKQDQNIGNLNELIFLKERYIDSTKNYASHLNQEYRDFEERATKKKQEYEIVLKDLNEKNIGLQDSLSLIAESIKKIDSIKIANLSKVIPTIKIGNQEWMTTDINTTIYYNGDPIIEAKTSQQWKACNDKKEGCYRRLSNGTYVYNGYAISDKRGIVPSGFIIPKDEQFKQLFNFLGGGDTRDGKATKSMLTYPIYIEEWNAEADALEAVEIKSNGSSGFNAVQGGFVYDHGGNDDGWDNCNYWWTSSTEKTDENITVHIVVDIGYCSQDIGGGVGSYPWGYGFAVRACK